jgi:uncharacterized protein (TIGR03066 family)
VRVALAAVSGSPAVAAEPAEEVLGKWVSTDPKAQPMEFLKDGKFKFGWTKDTGKWEMADGTYKIDKDGKIDATASKGGVSLTLKFKLDKGAIIGSIGAKEYTFKKEAEKKDK